MPLSVYKCFRFSEVIDQMFLMIQGAVQGSFRATSGVASVFFPVVSRQDGELEDVPPHTSVFSSV